MSSTAPAGSAPRRFATRKMLVRAAFVVAALALLWSALALVVPAVLKNQVANAASDKLGRRLSFAKVAFNPWTLELTIDDLSLAGARPASPPQLQVKHIHADAALLSVFRFAPIIDALEIEAPMVRLSHLGDGGYDIDDMLQRLAAAPAEKSEGTARFAVHNIVVHGGGADVADVPVGATHRVRDIELGVPFLSSLPSEREIKVEPRLAFTLDGSRFDSATAATPFAERGAGVTKVRLDHFDVTPWLPYVPRSAPIRLQSAMLSADLAIAFEQRPTLALRLSGVVEAAGIRVADTASRELLQVGNVKVAIADLRPLESVARLSRIDIDAPHVLAVRNAAGHVNLMLAAEEPSGAKVAVARVPLPTSAASAARQSAAAASGAARAATPAAAASPWKVSLAALSVRAGQLDWRDATVAPEAAFSLADFSLDAQAIGWPLDAPVVFKGEGRLASAANTGKEGGNAAAKSVGSAAAPAAGTLAFSGQGNGAGATVSVRLDALPLALARSYLNAALALPLAGALSADVAVAWRPGGGGSQLSVDANRVALSGLVLGDAKAADFTAEQIEVSDARIDTVARTAAIGRLVVQAPRLRVDRDRAGRWNVNSWSRETGEPAAAARVPALEPAPVAARAAARAAPHPAASAPAAQALWRVVFGEVSLAKGRASFTDHGLDAPVALDVIDLGVQTRGWALDTTSAAPFHLTARLAVPAGPTGKAAGAGVVGSIDAQGELRDFVAGVPSAARASLLLKDLPLQLVDPYLDEVFNIDVQKAQTSFKGNVAWERHAAGPSLALRGDATVDDFRATNAATDRAAPQRALAMVNDGSPGRQLLNWKSLSLRGIDVAIAPGTPARISVAETALSDFFARIVLDENGRLNLQDVTRASAPASASSPVSSASAAPPVAAAPRATSAPAPATGVAPATATATATSTASSDASLTPIVKFGPIAVVNGRLAYNDRFVKPNYSANLSELKGKLAAFSSQPPAPGEPPLLADLSLQGRVEGTASLDISGKVNPLAKPLALDIKAKVRDLELPPLSPYAIKYSGYGIERGKMSVDLAYVVLPSGQLTASNKIVLHQLAFGDKVEGSTASLPVKLAVALLADRHGVIDLDLPVSGSINDPQFSLGGVIWKVITNLIVKAVTAPFSLLASAFGGGGSELSTIEFAPGSAALTPAAKETLDKVAKALVERPAVNLTVSGESRLESERDAWKRERLAQALRAEKRRQAIAGSAAANAEITVTDSEAPALLKEVYKRADIVKPKNLVGFAKDLAPQEMEALLLASMTVADDAMQQLAVRRAVVVRDYLATKELPTSRLFLGAPKVSGDAAAWKPRADLKLAVE